MTGVITIAILCMATGYPVCRLLSPDSTGERDLSLSFLAGSGVITFLLVTGSFAGNQWTRAGVLAFILVVASACWFVLFRSGIAIYAGSWSGRANSWTSIAFDLLVVVLAIGHLLYVTVGPSPETDFLSIWGLKGRMFFEFRGVDWAFLRNPDNDFAHPDYPLLLPTLFAMAGVIEGSWSDQALGLFSWLFAASLLLFLRGEIGKLSNRAGLGACAWLVVASFALSPWIGLAEGALVAFMTTGVLLIRGALDSEKTGTIYLGALMLGFAAWTKNEGQALVLAVAIAALIVSRSRARLLWALIPAFALLATWMIVRALHQLPSDVLRGSLLETAMSRLRSPAVMIDVILQHNLGRPLFWSGIALGLLCSMRHLLAKERFLLLVVGTQFFFYICIYLVTPNDIVWQIRWSWERVVGQLTLLIAFAVLAGVVPRVEELAEGSGESKGFEAAKSS